MCQDDRFIITCNDKKTIKYIVKYTRECLPRSPHHPPFLSLSLYPFNTLTRQDGDRGGGKQSSHIGRIRRSAGRGGNEQFVRSHASARKHATRDKAITREKARGEKSTVKR